MKKYVLVKKSSMHKSKELGEVWHIHGMVRRLMWCGVYSRQWKEGKIGKVG